jgi:hypothetical protein
VTAAHAHRSSLRSVAQRDALYEVEGRPQRVKSHAADDRGAGPEGEEAAPERLVDRWACGGVVSRTGGRRGGLASARGRNTHFFSSLSSLGSKNGSFH